MYFQYISLFMLLATSINFNCSQINLNKFKQLPVSTDARCQLATQKDIVWLKKSFAQDKNYEEQMHDPFKRYQREYDYCKAQKNTGYLGMFCFSAYSVVSAYFSLKNDTKIPWILTAIALAKAALMMQKEAQDYEHDQDLLIRKCTEAFEMSDLEKLQIYYEEKSDKNSEQFLKLIIKRKAWVTENQSSK